MQPTQPETPSGEPTQDAAATATDGSPETQEASRPNWVQRLFGRRGADESTATDQPEPPAASRTLSYTQEEFDRRVQAETDRRENKRRDEAKVAERKHLRDTDPYAYADAERAEEQRQTADQQISGLFTNIGAEYDKYALDPLVLSLPEAERTRILAIEGAGRGLDGRKLIVEETLKSLEKQWKADGAKDAEARLRRNPAFRKQILNEMRSGGLREPEFISGGAPSAADQSVSNILREQLRGRTLST